MCGVFGGCVERIRGFGLIGLRLSFAAVIVGEECDGSDNGGGESDDGGFGEEGGRGYRREFVRNGWRGNLGIL